jgi:Tfp pilus assembly protein PilO
MTSDPRPLWRRRLLKPVLVLLGLNAALFAAYTLPRLVQVRSLEARRRSLDAQVAGERARGAAARERAIAVRDNERDSKRFYKEVVGSRDETLLPLLRRLGEIASELGLQPATSTYKPEEVKGAPLTRFVITLPITGTYRDVVSFLDQLERLPQFVTVDRLAIRGPSAGDGPTDLDLTLSAYFLAEEGGA